MIPTWSSEQANTSTTCPALDARFGEAAIASLEAASAASARGTQYRVQGTPVRFQGNCVLALVPGERAGDGAALAAAARAEGELAGLLFDPALRVAETFPIPKDR